MAVIQVSWVAVQVIVRSAKGLTILQLELMTTAFSLCAIITYLFLIPKPQGVQTCNTTSDLVKFRVGVGEEKEVFMCISVSHCTGSFVQRLTSQAFACDASPVLNAAFNSTFLEGSTKIYTLFDTDPEIFNRFVQWLYSKNFASNILDSATKELHPNLDMQKKFDAETLKLLQLWVLADKLLAPRLQNVVTEEIYVYWRKSYAYAKSTVWIPYVYANTLEDSPLRRFAVRHAVYLIDSAVFKQHPSHFSHEMLLELGTESAKCITARESNPEKFACQRPFGKAIDFFVLENCELQLRTI